jgi:hypothetical protein
MTTARDLCTPTSSPCATPTPLLGCSPPDGAIELPYLASIGAR